jgi:ankyrin repeat protein
MPSDWQNVNAIWRSATPLMMALGHAGHFPVAEALLQSGADPNAGTSLLHAACEWHFAHLLPALRWLAERGWEVNSRDASGQTALHKAAFLGYSAAIRTLLDCHADPGARDSAGMTPLDIARQAGKPVALQALQP